MKAEDAHDLIFEIGLRKRIVENMGEKNEEAMCSVVICVIVKIQLCFNDNTIIAESS